MRVFCIVQVIDKADLADIGIRSADPEEAQWGLIISRGDLQRCCRHMQGLNGACPRVARPHDYPIFHPLATFLSGLNKTTSFLSVYTPNTRHSLKKLAICLGG